MEIGRVRTVVLAGGRSRRMGFDKLVAPLAGISLARRVVLALRELNPLVVATPAVAALVAELPFVQLVVTEPTVGPAVTLRLAHAVVPQAMYLAVLPCDLPFLDGARVAAFIERARDDADLAWPLVGGTPGHPVLWSPSARERIGGLRDHDPPLLVRSDPVLRAVAMTESDDAYVSDVDTPEAWDAAVTRCARAPAS